MSKDPKDATYHRFASKLADSVLKHINSGGKITENSVINGPECCCPVGVVTGPGFRYPGGAIARQMVDWIRDTPSMAPTSFMEGFDGVGQDIWCLGHTKDAIKQLKPYYDLGVAYRKRFVENVS